MRIECFQYWGTLQLVFFCLSFFGMLTVHFIVDTTPEQQQILSFLSSLQPQIKFFFSLALEPQIFP
jgi:hypothetical protein